MTAHQKQLATYAAGNHEAAAIVLADPERYPVGSLLAIWAELVLNPPAERSRPEIGRPA